MMCAWWFCSQDFQPQDQSLPAFVPTSFCSFGFCLLPFRPLSLFSHELYRGFQLSFSFLLTFSFESFSMCIHGQALIMRLAISITSHCSHSDYSWLPLSMIPTTSHCWLLPLVDHITNQQLVNRILQNHGQMILDWS